MERFGQTWFGRFDLLIVIVTAPWFLLPGAGDGSFVVLLRVARLARVLMAGRDSRQLFQRIGRVALVAAGVTVTASVVAYYAEHPVNSEFATFGDALWWGIVTLTTVGYGDIVPKTSTGRWAAVVIMITGISVLGVLAGSLSSFFRISPREGTGEGAPASGAVGADRSEAVQADEPADASPGALIAQLVALRQQVELLSVQVAELTRHGDADPAG
jgi:voltage-gated potassium channel